MSGIGFTPDESVHIHEEGAIQLLCAHFRSHENGLPEWIKNSSDAYARADVSPDESVIVVFLQDGRRGVSARIACLDFGGMSTEDIERRFRYWADPEAAGSFADVEGGHGNGGKCYMTQLFDQYSYIHTVRDNRGNKYGFRSGSAKPGFFPSPQVGRGYRVADPDAELTMALADFNVSIEKLPETAQAVWRELRAFTLVLGVGAKLLNRGRISPSKWIEKLRGHQQMARSLERNHVFVFHNGRLHADAAPLRLEEIEPIPGAEAPRVAAIPPRLIDPLDGEAVITGSIDGVSRLILRTSDKSMRWGLKARHTINAWTHNGRSTGFWEVPTLSKGVYSDKIYGDLYLESLKEYKQNDRRNHSDAPLTRAIRQWTSEQLEAYAAEFARLDKLQATKEEQLELSRLNELLNLWKNQFLDEEFGGAGNGTTNGTGEQKKQYRLPRGEVDHVVLTLSHSVAGQGVTFRPRLEFYDRAGTRVRAVPYEWESNDWAVATIDQDLNMITTHCPGPVDINILCKDSGLRSNIVTLEVLDLTQIDLAPDQIELRVGSRHPLIATLTAKNGRIFEGGYLIWNEDNPEIVTVGSSGMVYGLAPGLTRVVAGDNQVETLAPTTVQVIEAARSRENGGDGFPRILLSEIDQDPFSDSPPIFSEEHPPIHQRPIDVDANVWWINMASPLARRYINSAKGGGAKSKEWRVYMLERYIEIMVKIKLNYDFMHGEELTFETMVRRWEEESVAMQQRAAASLSDFLSGEEVEVAA
jgi:hypothetical protein